MQNSAARHRLNDSVRINDCASLACGFESDFFNPSIIPLSRVKDGGFDVAASADEFSRDALGRTKGGKRTPLHRSEIADGQIHSNRMRNQCVNSS